MQYLRIVIIAAAVILGVVFSGCTTDSGTGTPPAPVPTPAPAAAPTTAPVTMTAATSPQTVIPTTEPVRPPPPERQVNLVLTKDRPTSEIHLLYQGGPGDMFVQRILMRVYSPETVYREYEMSSGRKPLPGDEIVAPGTRSGDRCEVFVISGGIRYKVMDEPVYGGMYY
jgi:hypothetical protein